MLAWLRAITLYLLGFIIAAVAGTFILGDPDVDDHMAFTFLAPLVVVWLLEWRWRKRSREAQIVKNQRERDALLYEDRKQLNGAVSAHHAAVARNFRRAVTTNDYGAISRDDRDVATEEFLSSVGVMLRGMSIPEATAHIQAILDGDRQESIRIGFDPATMPVDGFEFEAWVAEGLAQFGWDAYATRGTGDQGVDVVARRAGKSIALQCKLYSKPVGNKAVQEAFSGARYMRIDRAAVISNAGFTKSAQELAAENGVLLLSPEDIPTLHEKIT